MHDKQLIRRTCTQRNDHGVVTVWPAKIKVSYYSVKAWQSSLDCLWNEIYAIDKLKNVHPPSADFAFSNSQHVDTVTERKGTRYCSITELAPLLDEEEDQILLYV